MGVHVLKLPDVGEGVAEAEIVEWLVEEGANVQEDETVASVMTDKATVEVPAPVDGVVTWLAGAIGETIAVGAPLIRIETAGTANEQAAAAPANDADEPVEIAEANTASTAASVESDKPSSGRSSAMVLAAPAVRARARALGVDLASVAGTGPAGRVTHGDLDAALVDGDHAARGNAPASVGTIAVPIVGLRRKIAENIALAASSIPHISYVEEVDVTALEALRATMNETRAEGRQKLTLLPFLMQAMVRAIEEQPQFNAHYDDAKGVLHQSSAVHVGVATQTDDGLVVPVVRHAEARSVWECAAEIARLADAARDGASAREDLSGSTITISSLGALGGVATTPLINRPEVAIVGVNRIRTLPHWDGERFTPRKMMNLSSSVDHRIIDGWDIAVFIQKIKALLETPALMFVDN
ncbi:MAG: dihydrolipoamide acetyltransferase family protein [Pseudomonadota bacterium]